MRKFVCTLFACASLPLLAAESLVGKPAPEWNVTNWLNSPPLRLAELHGKVVLVRWWTAPACRYCAATAPALNEFHQKFAQHGLVVVGLYHHKSEEPLDIGDVKRHAKRFGFKFPVAIDPEWRTLESWWLNQRDRDWTNVSFLIDREGVVRYVHPGGQYVKGDKDYRTLRALIEELLEK